MAAVEREFQRVLDDDLLRTVFQPVVRVDNRAVVGHEGLVRGPAGSILESPDALIREAYRQKRVVEFDWAARASASRAALAADLSADDLVLLNIEPLALASDCPPKLWPVIEEAFETFHVVLEVTERSLDRDPGTLLEGIDRQRAAVSGLALDDVGADVRTLSMLPALEPDVIKLDLRVTQEAPNEEAMKVLNIAYEEAERTGATILAEGVETERHHEVVRQLGAPLAQGWLYGGPTGDPGPADVRPVQYWSRSTDGVNDVRAPFDALDGRTISRADASLLAPLGDEIFRNAMRLLGPALVMMVVPDHDLLGRSTLNGLSRLARRRVITGVVGADVPAEPAPNVRGSWTTDPWHGGQWAIVAISPSTAVGMLARRTVGSQFDFGVTHNRRRIISAARCLLRQLGPQPGNR
jgi:EAL domain-containing protein (putative c-di-GMP-specific phosphodiesterase class I)